MSRPRIRDIVALASRLSGVSEADILGKSRLDRFVRIRAAVVVIARAHGWSYPMIGKSLGGRDHSTAINAARIATELAERDDVYREFIAALRTEAANATPFLAPRADLSAIRIREDDAPVVTSRLVSPVTHDENHVAGIAALRQGMAHANDGFVAALMAERAA